MSVLTKPALLNLLGRQGKHRKYFHHYFHDNIRQYRSGWYHGIDLETSEEVP